MVCMGQQRSVIDKERAESPWVGIAREDAKDWWRQHPGAPFSEFAEWADRRYLPVTLSGMGWRGDRPLTPKEQEALADVYVGLSEAATLETRLREYRRRSAA